MRQLTSILCVLLGVTAWLGVTFGPIPIAIGAWKLAEKIKYGWIAHLLLVPALAGSDWVFADLLASAAGDTGGTPGFGLAFLPGFAVFLVTVIAYYISLSVGLIRKLSRRGRHA